MYLPSFAKFIFRFFTIRRVSVQRIFPYLDKHLSSYSLSFLNTHLFDLCIETEYYNSKYLWQGFPFDPYESVLFICSTTLTFFSNTGGLNPSKFIFIEFCKFFRLDRATKLVCFKFLFKILVWRIEPVQGNKRLSDPLLSGVFDSFHFYQTTFKSFLPEQFIRANSQK